MQGEYQHLAAAAARLAERLPYSLTLAVAEEVGQGPGNDVEQVRRAILACGPTAEFRAAAAEFVTEWRERAGRVSAEAVAVALLTAAKSAHSQRHGEKLEIVWTGPEFSESRFRQTEQAILELITGARRHLTVVSYAVYRIPRIREALIDAVRRGVVTRLIVETPNRHEGQGEYDCVLALGTDVASACQLFYWPPEHRLRDPNGKVGILHVKCAVADGHRLFLSSANFTDYAFNINMELGLLVSGGKRPGQIERHFDRLIEQGVLLELRR